MKHIKEMLMVLVLFLLMGNVSADESYEITLTILRPDNVNDLDNTTWSKYDTITIDKDERVNSVYSIMVEDVALSSETVMIEVIEDGERVVRFIKVNEAEIFEFEESDSPPIKIKVDSAEEGGFSSSSAVAEDDEVVRIWVAPNSLDELSLTKDSSIPDSYNPSEFGKTSGWSGSGSIEYVVLYIERLQEIDGITIMIEGGDWDEIGISDDNKRKFELNENAVYTFTINYEERDIWGGIKDETEVYKLSVNGLLYGTNTGTPSNPLTTTYETRILESFNGDVGSYIIVETDTQGVWEEVDGAVIKFVGQTPTRAFSWKIKFDSVGTHEVGFKNTDGSSGYYKFTVEAKDPAPAATVAASQSTTGDESNSGTVVLILGALILIGAAGIFLNKKNRDKKGRNNGNVRNSPELDT